MSAKEKNTINSDFITNKLISVLCIACVYAIFVMVIRLGYADSSSFMFCYVLTKVLFYLSLAGVVFGIVKEVADRKKGKDLSLKVFTGKYIAGCCAVLAYVCYRMAYTDYIRASRFLYVLIAALSVLYLVYMVYKREFFVVALSGSVITLYIWQFARYAGGTGLFIFWQIVILAVLAALIVLISVMKKTGGTLTFGSTRYRFMQLDAEYVPTLIGLAIFAAAALSLFFVPLGAMIYIAYGCAAVVFAFAIYFTVIMM